MNRLDVRDDGTCWSCAYTQSNDKMGVETRSLVREDPLFGLLTDKAADSPEFHNRKKTAMASLGNLNLMVLKVKFLCTGNDSRSRVKVGRQLRLMVFSPYTSFFCNKFQHFKPKFYQLVSRFLFSRALTRNGMAATGL